MNSKIINEVVVEEMQIVDDNLKFASNVFLGVGIPTLAVGLVTRNTVHGAYALGYGFAASLAGLTMKVCKPDKRSLMCKILMRQHMEESEVKENEDSSECI